MYIYVTINKKRNMEKISDKELGDRVKVKE